jgi:hypothetical protein
MDKLKKSDNIISHAFINDIRHIIINARIGTIRSVDFQRTMMYWKLGERIFTEETVIAEL